MLKSSTLFSAQNFPFPYQAAIAFSNDCEFLTYESYEYIRKRISSKRFLNIPISNSIFFYVTNSFCHSSIGYFDENSFKESQHAGFLRELIQEGVIDTIHAYGDFDCGGFQRSMAERLVKELDRHSLRLKVFTNHGSNQNFQNMGHQELTQYQKGDDPSSEYYHADLMDQLGVKYIWVDNGADLEFQARQDLIYNKTCRDKKNRNFFHRYRGLRGRPAPNLESFLTQVSSEVIQQVIQTRSALIFYQHFGVAEKLTDGTFKAATPPLFNAEQLERFDELYRLRNQKTLWLPSCVDLLEFEELRKSTSGYFSGLRFIVKAPTFLAGKGLCFFLPKKPVQVDVYVENAKVTADDIEIIAAPEGYFVVIK